MLGQSTQRKLLSQLPPRRPPLSLPARFGRYRLTRLIAVGGMAEIYLAKSFGARGFVKPLVIKRLDPRLADEPYFAELFVNEAKLLVTLNHGNIVPVFDFGTCDKDLYIAMEYVQGISLKHLLGSLRNEGAELQPLLAGHIAAEVCKGLDYAHNKANSRGEPEGIVHRDVKPTNILLSIEGEVKIVDFGVAKLASREVDRSLAGTLSYMSPEQASRQRVDPRTDVFSTGLVLHEMLAGAPAYTADDAQDMLRAACAAAVPALPTTVPAELRELVARATQRDVEARYASAHAMERDLAEFLLLSRSAGIEVQTISPATQLSAIVRRFTAAEELDGDADDVLAEAADAPHTISLLDDARPIDHDLLRDAAETFHSEFLTMAVLPGERRGWSRKKLALVIAAMLVVVVGSALATYALLRSPTPRATAAGAGATPRADTGIPPAPAPDFKISVVQGPDAAPTRPDARSPRQRVRHKVTAPARARGHGFLTLTSIPWSRVSIDGHPLPRPTPLLKLRLPVGAHRITLENPELRLRKTIRVRIEAGVTSKKVVRLR